MPLPIDWNSFSLRGTLKERLEGYRAKIAFDHRRPDLATRVYLRVDLPAGCGGPATAMMYDMDVPEPGGFYRCRVNKVALVLAKIADVGDRPPLTGREHLNSLWRNATQMSLNGDVSFFELLEFRLMTFGESLEELQAAFDGQGLTFTIVRVPQE